MVNQLLLSKIVLSYESREWLVIENLIPDNFHKE